MTPARAALLLALLLLPARAAGEGKSADPWVVPDPDPAELAVRITLSDREYVIRQVKKVPDEARAPEAVVPPAADAENAEIGRCRGLLDGGKAEEAVAALQALLGKSPALHAARSLLGRALLAAGKTAEAAVALRDALLGNRRDPEGWKALDAVAAPLGRKVVRPRLEPRGWILPEEKKTVPLGYADSDREEDFPWIYYAFARAVYRYEGPYAREFPGKAWRFTFREMLFAAAAAARGAANVKKDGKKVPEDLARLATERKGKDFAAFVFWAMYPEPIAAEPERDFEALRPALVKHFDEKILVKKP